MCLVSEHTANTVRCNIQTKLTAMEIIINLFGHMTNYFSQLTAAWWNDYVRHTIIQTLKP